MKRIALFLLLLLALAFSTPASATLSTLASQITTSATGSATVFQFPFTVGGTSEIAVIVTNSSGLQTTLPPSQYLVALNPVLTGNIWPIGGSVTVPLSGQPYAAGNTITIMRVVPLLQTTALSNQGSFYPQAVEAGLDTGVMQTQQVAAKNGTIRGTWTTGTLFNYGDIVVDGPAGADTQNLYSCAIPNTSGTWSTDLANGDWVLALNVQGIVNFNPSISNNYLFANISGGSEAPYGVSGTAYLDSAFGSTQGSLLYRNNTAWSVLPPGTNGFVLKTQGAGANPVWSTPTGSGTVTAVNCGSGLTCSPSPIIGIGTASLSTVANNSLLANISGMSAAPGATTLSALMDVVIGTSQGTIPYRSGTMWTGSTFPFGTRHVVTGSRAVSGIYQNTTGKTMFVVIVVTTSVNQIMSVVSDNSSSPSGNVGNTFAPSNFTTFTFPVVNGDYYQLTGQNTGAMTIGTWTEWY